MSDTAMSIPTPTERVSRPKKRPNIKIDDDVWMPLEAFAARIGTTVAVAKRLNLLTVEIGDATYVNSTLGLREIAAQAKRRYGWET